ncbi:hypothetical protein [Pseudomonas sp. CGJS7]|uniref:hypothetical protein n=1 Tax=Pseudomonas sp. CGJS7 TaxID=3109348 RepID=UPI003008417E
MQRRDLLRLSALTALLAFTGQLPAADTQSPTDLMPAFWRAYDAGRDADDRAQALHDAFFVPNAELYAGAGLKPTLERLNGWLPKFDAIAADTRRMSDEFGDHYRRHSEHFQREFPDFQRERAPIYLMPSLLMFDGHLRPWRGKLPLFVGIDGIVRYHGADANLSVFLDHESFHLYHGQHQPELVMDDTPPIYGSLWMEGLATYVSERLNPDASRLRVLLDDQKLAAVDDAGVRPLAAKLLAVLDSRAEDDANRFFGAGYKGPEPARSGYLVGLTVAREIGRERTLAELAKIPMPQVRELLQQRLRDLANEAA